MHGEYLVPKPVAILGILVVIMGLVGVGIGVGTIIRNGDTPVIVPPPSVVQASSPPTMESVPTPDFSEYERLLQERIDSLEELNLAIPSIPEYAPDDPVQRSPAAQETEAPILSGNASKYADCMFETHLEFQTRSVMDFRIEDQGTYNSWDYGVRYALPYFVINHCEPLMPPPQEDVHFQCIPDSLARIYKDFSWDSNPGDNLKLIAGQFALSVCRSPIS